MSDTLRHQKPGQAPLALEPASRSQSPASHQPRKFDQLSDEAKLPKQDNSMRLEVAAAGDSPQRSRANSVSFTFNPPRQDPMSYLTHFPNSAGPSTRRPSTGGAGGTSAAAGGGGLAMGAANAAAPAYLPLSAYQMEPRLRPPSMPYKALEHDSVGSAAPPHDGPNAPPSRSTSIFSSLIQMPPSAENSVSGPSSKDQPEKDPAAKDPADYDSGKDSLGNIFTWSQRNSKNYDQNALWEQMNMPGSIAGITNESLNAFMSSLQSNGSIDLSNMSTEQRRASFIKFISDQGQNRRPSLGQTSLREDIFDPKMDPAKPGLENNHMSPTSSLSSKTSSRIHEEPQSPKASPHRLNSLVDTSMALPQGYASNYRQGYYQYPYEAALANQTPMASRTTAQQSPQLQSSQIQSPQHSSPQQLHSQQQQFQVPTAPSQQQYVSRMPQGYAPQMADSQNNAYSPLFKANQYVSPENITDLSHVSPLQAAPITDEKLVSAQQLARSEDGRPLLGATKVDQLMLVIQAREKGNQKAIKQAPDGSILGSPHQDHKAESVLPPSVELVGGIEKPVKEEDEEEESARKRRKGKKQQCPYCLKHFNQSTHLDVHMRSHIGYKPFQCTFCLKRFTQGGNLRTHMRLHTGEKPFKCEVCERQFSRKGNLAAHMLTHNKQKPFECRLDGCDKSFTQLGNLKSHQNKFHLPTLNRLTETFANVTGVALEQLPAQERELLDYFAKLYKNSNKGIRGRGKGKRVAQVDG